MPRRVHHGLYLVPLQVDDLPLVQPIHDRVRICEVLRWLLARGVGDADEAPPLLFGLQTLDFVPESVEEVVLPACQSHARIHVRKEDLPPSG